MERWLAPAAFFFSLAACGGSGPREVVGPRDVPGESGEPEISGVTDLGDVGLIPAEGKIPTGDSDGAFTVGELVLIEGEDFGKLPTVSIGSRPVEVLARTGNGGVVCRVPPGVPGGAAAVEVSHPEGRDAIEIEVDRYALAVEPGAGVVHVVELGADGKMTVRTALAIPGARDVAFSADGQAAYVIADPAGKEKRPGVAVIALAASGGPRVLHRFPLPGERTEVVVTARDRLVGAVLGDAGLTLLDLGVPRTPALKPPVKIPGSERAAAFHPAGRLLAVLDREKNELIPVDTSELSAPSPGVPLPLLPAERVPLAQDLGLSPGGDEIWVVAGDTEGSVVAGARPARLVVVDASSPTPVLERTVEVSGVAAPRALGVARREPIGGGTAIRNSRRQAVIVVAGAHRGLIGAESGFSADSAGELGRLTRTDLEGEGRVLVAGRWVFTDPEISHDLKWVVSAATRVGREGRAPEFGLALLPLDGGKLRFLRLGEANKKALLARGSVALAP